jgi:hypothetical protein
MCDAQLVERGYHRLDQPPGAADRHRPVHQRVTLVVALEPHGVRQAEVLCQ